jgi:hypothetical protein
MNLHPQKSEAMQEGGRKSGRAQRKKKDITKNTFHSQTQQYNIFATVSLPYNSVSFHWIPLRS